ncbi:MAG: hypothetical protein QM756_01445 [Polyangiaceae bacterium]
MPQVVHGGVRIHYWVEGEGAPLVLHHGSGSNGAAWISTATPSRCASGTS